MDDVWDTVKDHEDRIQALEKADIKLFTNIDNLIEKIDNLAGWMKGLIIALITTFGGFFIWSVQQLISK